MGCPTGSLVDADISEKQMASLCGEALHLGCLGLVLYSIFLTNSAPWWGPKARALAPEVGNGPEAKPPAKRRRTAALIPRKSQM